MTSMTQYAGLRILRALCRDNYVVSPFVLVQPISNTVIRFDYGPSLGPSSISG